MAKPYNTKSLQENVGKTTPEEGGKGTAGLYRHPESGQEAVTLWDPLFGDTQSNAFERLGFVRVGDAPEGYVKHLDVVSAIQANGTDETAMKGLNAPLSVLERVQVENEALKVENERLRAGAEAGSPTDHEVVVAEVAAAKAAAEVKSAEALGGSTDGAGTSQPEASEEDADDEVEKPLSEQTKDELLETAKRENVEVAADAKVKDLRLAIEAARVN